MIRRYQVGMSHVKKSQRVPVEVYLPILLLLYYYCKKLFMFFKLLLLDSCKINWFYGMSSKENLVSRCVVKSRFLFLFLQLIHTFFSQIQTSHFSGQLLLMVIMSTSSESTVRLDWLMEKPTSLRTTGTNVLPILHQIF